MLKKQVLRDSLAIDLALPKDGFSQAFITDLVKICSRFSELEEGSVLLKKSGGEVSVFFCFLFDGCDEENILRSLAEEILSLFKEQIAIDVISLNGKEELQQAVRSVTVPFYKR